MGGPAPSCGLERAAGWAVTGLLCAWGLGAMGIWARAVSRQLSGTAMACFPVPSVSWGLL